MAKRKRKSKTSLVALAAWMQAHRDLWLGWRDGWTWFPRDDIDGRRIWTACVKALKKDRLVCATSYAPDINVAKIIRKAQAHDYIGFLLAKYGSDQ